MNHSTKSSQVGFCRNRIREDPEVIVYLRLPQEKRTFMLTSLQSEYSADNLCDITPNLEKSGDDKIF